MDAAEERRIVERARDLEAEARRHLRGHPAVAAVFNGGANSSPKRLQTAIDAEILRKALARAEQVDDGPLVDRARSLIREADTLYWRLALQWRPWAYRLVMSAGHDEGMVQEALYGLYLGAIRFDPDRGRYSTYARTWLQQIVRRAKQRDHLVPRPPYVHEIVPRIHQVQSMDPQRSWTTTDLARSVGSQEHLVRQALEIGAPLSLSHPLHEDDDRLLVDNIAEDEEIPLAQRAEEASWARRRAWSMILRIPARYQVVLVLRGGLDGQAELSLQAIAMALGVSRERIRQLQRSAAEAMLDLKVSRCQLLADLPDDPVDLLAPAIRDLIHRVRHGDRGLEMP